MPKSFIELQDERAATTSDDIPSVPGLDVPQAPAAPRKSFVDGLTERAADRAAMAAKRFRDTTSAAAITATQRSEQSREVLGQSMQPEAFLRDGRVTDAFLDAELRGRLRENDELALWASEGAVNAALYRDYGKEFTGLGAILNSVGRGTDSAISGGFTGSLTFHFGKLLSQTEQAQRDAGLTFGEIVQDVKGGIASDAQLSERAEESPTRAFFENMVKTNMAAVRNVLAPIAATERFVRSRKASLGIGRHTEDMLGFYAQALEERAAAQQAQRERRAEWWPQARAVIRGQKMYEAAVEGASGADKWAALGQFVIDNPGETFAIAASTTLESLGPLTAATLATATTKSPGLGIAVNTGMNAGRMQDASAVDVAQDMGYDISKREDLVRLLADPEARVLWQDRAMAYTLTVAAVDALSGGIAGRQLTESPAGEMVLQGLTQAVMGSGGEALGRLAADLEMDPLEIALEGLAELVMAPVESFGAAGQSLNREVRGRLAEREARTFFEALANTANASDLRTQVPAKYREVIDRITKDGPVETVQLDSNALPELFQSGKLSIEQLVEAVPELTVEGITEAIDAGRDLVIPTSVYASVVVGTDIEPLLREHLRLNGSMTSAEVAAADERADDALMAEVQQRVADITRGAEETNAAMQDAIDDLRTQIAETGASQRVASAQALQLVTFSDVMARRTGRTFEDFTKEFPLPQVSRSDTPAATPATVAVDAGAVSEALSAYRDAAAENAQLDMDTPPGDRRANRTKLDAAIKQARALVPQVPDPSVLSPEQLALYAEAQNAFPNAQRAIDQGETVSDADVIRAVDAWLAVRDTLNQRERGAIVLPPKPGDTAQIRLTEGADLSTVLHESGHYFLWLTEQVTRGENAPASVVEDFDALKTWWRENAKAAAKDGGVAAADVEKYLDDGTTGSDDTDRDVYRGLQEQFARAYEAYLMEGKAPTPKLARLFDLLSAWLTQVYRTVRNLDVELNDEVRGVFDRLLATQEEIDKAQRVSRSDTLVAASAEALGVDEEEWQKILELSEEARAEARRAVMADVMQPIRNARRAEFRAKVKELRETVRNEIGAQPVHRLVQWLGNDTWYGEGDAPGDAGDFRIDRDMLIEDYGEDVVKRLTRGKRPIYAKGTGISADELAPWFGYASGDAMIEDLKAAPKFEAAVRAKVNERVRKEVGDPLSDGSIGEMAVDALTGEAHGRVIDAELRALGRRATTKRPDTVRSRLRDAARRQIADMPVRMAVRTGTYRQAMERAAERAQQALARGDADEAYDQKRKQLLNHALFMESKAAAENLEKTENLVKRVRSKGARKNIDGDYIEAIDEILDQYDFRKSSTEAQEKRRGRLLLYVQMMEDAGRANELAPATVAASQRVQRTPYKSLSVRDLAQVSDAIKNIEHTGRQKKKLTDARDARDMETLVSEMLASGETNVKRKRRSRAGETAPERYTAKAREFFNLVLNADTMLRRFDGWDKGVWYDNVKAPIDAAAQAEQVMRVDAAEKLDEVYAPYTPKERRQMARQKHHPQLTTRMDREANFSQWDLISMALNMGNEDNLARLMDKDNGYGLNKAQVEYVKSQLSERDWDFVQSVWDHIDSFWPDIAAREKRQTGVTPTKVNAVEVATPFGKKPGGYYPIKYDPRHKAKTDAEEVAQVQMNMQAGRFGKAQTRDGHLQERAGGSGGRVLQLGMQVYHQHLGQVIHDLAYSEAVNNAWRVLHDPRVEGFFETRAGIEDLTSLELWLQDTATGTMVGGGILGRISMQAKNNFTLSKLAFSMSTVLIQATGLSQSAVQIGKRDFMKGYMQYMAAPQRWADEVKEVSTFMQERETTFHRDIYELMGDLNRNPLSGRVANAQTSIATIGLYLMQKVQYYVVDLPTWIGAYNQGLAKFSNSEQRAREYADRMVARAQASGLIPDRSAIERGTLSRDTRMNGFVRLFTALGSYMFAKGNVAHERAGRMRDEITGLNGRSALAVIDGTFDMALLFTLEAVMYHAIKGTLPWGDEDEDDMTEFLARETIASVMSTVPIARDLSSALSGFDGGGAYGSIMSEISKPFLQAAQGEVDLALWKALSSGAGIATGLPSAQANRVLDAWWRTSEGDDVAPIEFLMGRR